MAGNEADTPLGREYARLADWRTAAPEHDQFTGRQAFTTDELAIWTAPVGSKRLVGPPDHWPNPVVVREVVIAVAFSPGCLFALDRGTRRPVWSQPLGYFGHPVVPGPPGSGLVYAGTSQELLAVEAATGRIEWPFCPYGRQGESVYSRPAVADGRLFIGDRRG